VSLSGHAQSRQQSQSPLCHVRSWEQTAKARGVLGHTVTGRIFLVRVCECLADNSLIRRVVQLCGRVAALSCSNSQSVTFCLDVPTFNLLSSFAQTAADTALLTRTYVVPVRSV